MSARAGVAVALLLVAGVVRGESEAVVVRRADVAFGVREPARWRADVGHAGRFGAHVVLYRDRRALKAGSGLIKVRLDRKADHDSAADLGADIDAYRRRFATLELRDLDVAHPTYRCFAKELAVAGLFHEYVTYVDPGAGPERLSAALDTDEAATPDEIAAFRTVVASLIVLGDGP